MSNYAAGYSRPRSRLTPITENPFIASCCPCPGVICLGLLARQASELTTGDSFCAEGRVQSRVYLKVVDGETQQRTAYEVSVMHMANREDFPPE